MERSVVLQRVNLDITSPLFGEGEIGFPGFTVFTAELVVETDGRPLLLWESVIPGGFKDVGGTDDDDADLINQS